MNLSKINRTETDINEIQTCHLHAAIIHND
jgi:hypothetical protein